MINVICLRDAKSIIIQAGKELFVTEEGKMYKCMLYPFDSRYCSIYADNNHGMFYKNDFVTISDWREQQIKTVLDD